MYIRLLLNVFVHGDALFISLYKGYWSGTRGSSFIHAFFPDLFITSTSDIVNIVWNDLRSSGCHKSKDQEIQIGNDSAGADSETVSDDTLSADGSRYYKKNN